MPRWQFLLLFIVSYLLSVATLVLVAVSLYQGKILLPQSRVLGVAIPTINVTETPPPRQADATRPAPTPTPTFPPPPGPASPTPTPAGTPGAASCPSTVAPVCGVDRTTYANACLAKVSRVPVAYEGRCIGDPDLAGAALQASSGKAKVTQTFTVGPGPDREQFAVTTTGVGSLTVELAWVGSAASLKLEVAPRAVPEKSEENELGRVGFGFRLAAVPPVPSDVDDVVDESMEETFSDAGGLLYVRETGGAAPLALTVELDPLVMRELLVTITSTEGEASGDLKLRGNATITKVTRTLPKVPALSGAGRIIVPLVMHQLDRYFKNVPPTQRTALDNTFADHLNTRPLAHGKLQNALRKYQTIPVATKKKLFNAKVVTTLEALAGGSLSAAKVKDIQDLLKSTLPPEAPQNLAGSVTLTDPDAPTGGKLFTLTWQHPSKFATSYVVERAAAVQIEPQDPTLEAGTLAFAPRATVKVTKPRGGKPPPTAHSYEELQAYTAYPELYCYRVKAVNANGASGWSTIVCPELTGIAMVYSPYHVKWTTLYAVEESDLDGLSNSDEPYLIFTVTNGRQADGQPNTWTRRFTGADDVDSGETEPDDGPAAFTLIGPPPPDAIQSLRDLETALANTPAIVNGAYNSAYADLYDQISAHQWGPRTTRNADRPGLIDLTHGATITTTVMEHDAGDPKTLAEQIQAGIDAALDIAEAFSSPDPYHVGLAIKSTLEFLYALWSGDDLVGTDVWTFTYWDAWSLAAPAGAGGYGKTFAVDGGGAGHYNLTLCLYPDTASPTNLQASCGSNPRQ